MVTTIRLPDELHRALKKQAETRGMTFNGYVLSVLWSMVQEEGKSWSVPGNDSLSNYAE